MSEKLVEIKDLEISFGEGSKKFVAVKNANFFINKGETFSLVGESGSGKTTIGRAIIGLNDTSNGDIIFDGQKINGKKSREQAAELIRRIQMIFQDPAASLNERATVDYIISEGLYNHRLFKDEEERKEKVQNIIREVGLLAEHLTRYPHEFSGGQRQRIGIARALVMQPDFVIADEPISALLAGLSLSYLEIFWRKHIPEVISMIFVPFLSLIPALILAHTVLGPIGWTIGQGLSSVVLAGLTGPVKWLFGAIFGALYAPFVITGLHHMTNAIDTQLIADAGGTALWPMIALSNIAQGSAVFAYYFMHRHDEREAQVSLPATISAYLGVTEPALFGVNVKYIYPFVAGMTGSALAGMLSVTFNVTAASIGIGGLPGILSIQPQYMLPFAGTMLVAIVVPMLLTFFFRKAGLFTKTEGDTNLQAEFVAQEEAEFVSHEPVELTSVEIISPLTGQVKELSQATDPVFASGVMGQGLVIEPSQGELTSPVNGTVTVLFPTKHAIGIVSDEGVELLIHIGMDTVGLDGKGFESLVVQGDHVIVGQQLIRFDMDVIKAAGLVTETPVIITNQDAYTATITGTYPTTIQAGASLMVATRI